MAGERRAILGPNGAGKTTLFNLISGEFPPTAGSIEVFGRDVTRLPARTRPHMGLTRTFQKSRLFLGLTVEDNMYLAVLGVKRGHLRPVRTGRRPRDADAGPRAGRDRRPAAASSAPSSARCRTASSASSRSPWPARATQDHDARRARRRPLARRARRADRPAAPARPRRHAAAYRARHGRRAARRGAGDDDARRPRDRRGHARGDQGQPAGPRPLPGAVGGEPWRDGQPLLAVCGPQRVVRPRAGAARRRASRWAPSRSA